MVIGDARAVIEALADPRTLYVFGVIAARTSKLGMEPSLGARSTPYVTPFGLMRETSLSRDVVESVAERLRRAGLLEVLPADERGFDSWRISEDAFAAAAARRGPCAVAPCMSRGIGLLCQDVDLGVLITLALAWL